MHILFFSDNFPPEVNAPATRTFEHCREWVRKGHQVTVITCAPNFPSGKVFKGYKNKLWQQEEVEGIRVIRVWTYITANEGFARRILDYMSFMIMGFWASWFVRRPDIIIGTSPQFFTCLGAWFCAFLRRKPFVFELRDLWPESIRAVGAMEEGWILDMLEGIELFLYRRARLIVSVTNSFKENLVSRGINGDKIVVVTNGIDLTRFQPMPKDPDLLQQHNLAGKFIAGYVGTHGMAHALDALLRMAKKLKGLGHEDITLLLLGDGACKADLEQQIERENLSNVLSLKTVPKEEVARYWSLLDVAIIHLKKSETFKTVIPSKMFESMGMGIPILHGVEGESAAMIEENGVGLTVEPENEMALTEALLKLYTDQKLYQTLKKQGPVAARKYDRVQLAADMLQALEKITAGEKR